MKPIFQHRLTLLFCGCAIIQAPSAAKDQETTKPALSGNIQVQTTVFKVTGPDLPLSLLKMPLSEDEALFRKLAGMVADGSAELLADHHFTTPSAPELPQDPRSDPVAPSQEAATREGSVESVKETPYPTEYTPQRRDREMVPQQFEFKNCGLATQVQLMLIPQGPHAAPDSAAVGGRISVEQILGDQLLAWPVSLPGSPSDGSLGAPQFLTEKLAAYFRSADGRHHLVGAGRRAGETSVRENDYCLTFIKATPEDESLRRVAGSASGGALRLHALTFQLPTPMGRAFLRKRHESGGDAVLLNELLQATVEQKAELQHFASLQVDTLKLLDTRKPQSDSSAESPRPSVSLETIEEFMYPTEYSDGLLPKSFEFKNLGRTFEACVLKPEIQGQIRLVIRLQSYLAPKLFTWLEVPDGAPRRPQVHYPAFPMTNLGAEVSVQPGGVYFLGGTTLPPFFPGQQVENGRMQISLLKVIGGNSAGGNAADAPQPGISAEVFSLSPADAAVLKSLDALPTEAEALLARLTQSGAAHSISWCEVTGEASAELGLEMTAGVETPIPYNCVKTKAGLILPTEFEFHLLNHSLKISNRDDSGNPGATLNFMDCQATLIQPDTAQLENAADGKEKLTKEPKRFEIITSRPRKPDRFQILSLAAANVPSGHAEEGRWHAAVLRVQSR